MKTATINLEIDDNLVAAWKKIMHSHWWGGGLWRVPGFRKEMLPLTWREKEALAKLLGQIQPQVNAFRDQRRAETNQ